jgi:hypothetical protein
VSDYVVVSSADPGGFPGATRLSLGAAPGSEIEWLPTFFHTWRPSPSGEALLALAMGAHVVDKVTSRAATDDAWTRDLSLSIPVPDGFDPTPFAAPLSFLSGDRWQIGGYPSQARPFALSVDVDLGLAQELQADAVSLFSGGLDSLAGVIDFLERNPKSTLALVGHYDGGKASSRQQELWSELALVYGAERIPFRRLWCRPGPRTVALNLTPVENTTRGRSFLFIAAALAIAESIGPGVPVIVPENGYIALNVPLTRARVGSLSTRTTHPHYLGMLADAARAVGIFNPITNPYEFKTKGEMLAESANRPLLERLAPMSISCSHPEVGRWDDLPQGNCGYCYPCIIRQASMHAAGYLRDTYSRDVLGDRDFLDVSERSGADLRAVVNAVFASRPDRDVLRNGPLSRHREHYVATWRRGNTEIADWLSAASAGDLRVIIDRLV